MRDIGFSTDTNNEPVKPIGKYYLLVIAVDHYQNGITSLNNPVRDAANIARLLTAKYDFEEPKNFVDLRNKDLRYADRELYKNPIPVYNSASTCCLYNEDANSNNITEKLDVFAGRIGPNDALLIYCAGHGTIANNNYYLIPFNGEAGKRNSWYRVSDFYDTYNNYNTDKKCRDLLLILDCCYAGAISHGFGKKNGELFSRYVLTSCLYDQQASDGVDNVGSSFARSLEFVLSYNENPLSLIDKNVLNKKFQQYYREEFDTPPVQEISYTTLPMEVGESEFVFRIKRTDNIPVDTLARSFVDYLNFNDQKTDFEQFYYDRGSDDFLIISTVCNSFNVHKLQAKVLFEQFKNVSNNLELQFPSPIRIYPDLVELDIWETLRRELHIAETEHIKTYCVRAICDRMLVDNSTGLFKEPVVIYCGCHFQSEEQAMQIIAFCKQFLQLLNETKALPKYATKDFKRLFLYIADTRDGIGSFFDRSEMVKEIGDKPKIIVARAVTDLAPGFANKWLQLSRGKIQHELFNNLSVDGYFQGDEMRCEIQNFIERVGQDLQVDATKLHGQLWDYT